MPTTPLNNPRKKSASSNCSISATAEFLNDEVKESRTKALSHEDAAWDLQPWGGQSHSPGAIFSSLPGFSLLPSAAVPSTVTYRAPSGPNAIAVGDLLTTSGLPGHAMRVTDHGRANGAVLGKAMTALDEGTGLVLVLVSLQ